MANHNIHCILVDNKSSTDILNWSAFKKLDLGQEKIVPTNYPLMEFTRKQVQSLRSIELPVSTGSHPRQATIMVRFLLVDRSSAYNAIIGRTTLNQFGAVTSTTHLKMKFPIDHGVGEVKGDQQASRQCYSMSLEESLKALMHKNNNKEDK
jgi:hypothetical protein